MPISDGALGVVTSMYCSITESFCERCGTRYTFESPARRSSPLGALGTVGRGLRNFVASGDQSIDEAFAVARAEGVIPRWPDAAAYREAFYGRLVPPTADHRSSMLQDLERGRPTEIDAINGYVARRGAALGVPTPVNATLAHMIRARVRRARRDETPCSP